jgi:hypothetical protein
VESLPVPTVYNDKYVALRWWAEQNAKRVDEHRTNNAFRAKAADERFTQQVQETFSAGRRLTWKFRVTEIREEFIQLAPTTCPSKEVPLDASLQRDVEYSVHCWFNRGSSAVSRHDRSEPMPRTMDKEMMLRYYRSFGNLWWPDGEKERALQQVLKAGEELKIEGTIHSISTAPAGITITLVDCRIVAP